MPLSVNQVHFELPAQATSLVVIKPPLATSARGQCLATGLSQPTQAIAKRNGPPRE